jgi:hypothetical protein
MVTFKNNYNSRHDKEVQKRKAAKKKVAEAAKKKAIAKKRTAFREEFKRRHGDGKTMIASKGSKKTKSKS